MPGIGIILNPHSRSNRRNPDRIKRLGFIVGDKGSCHATQDILDVERLAREFKERKVDILGISGGDGTNHCTLTTFIEVYGDTPLPQIAFLRGGTMNNAANILQIEGSPEQILANLIRKYHAQEKFQTAELDLLNVNGSYGFLFGVGLVARFLDEYYKAKGSPSKAGFLLLRYIASVFFHTPFVYELFERFDAKVTVDGAVWPYKNYAVLHSGTIETYGLGFNPFFRAREKPGYMHMIGTSMTPLQLMLNLPRIWFNRAAKSENELQALAREVVIELAEPQMYSVDGDLKPPTTKLRITVGPRLKYIIS